MTENQKYYTVRFLSQSEYENWDRFISESENAGLFFTVHWAMVIRQVFSRNFKILALLKDEEIQAGFLHWPKSFLGFQMITRAPVTPYQDFVFKKSTKEKTSARAAEYHELSNLLLEHLQKEYSHIDMASTPDRADIRPYTWKNFNSIPKYTYRFRLLPFEELKAQFSQSLRRKIKKYTSEFEAVKSSETNSMADMVTDSYRHHGIEPPVTPAQLQKLFSVLADEDWAHFYYLQKDDKPYAGLLLLEDEHRVYSLFAGAGSTHRSEFVTEYLYTECMKQQSFAGKQFDFLGANTKDFEQFKRSFGGELQVYYELNYTRGKILRFLSSLRRKQVLLKRGIRGKS